MNLEEQVYELVGRYEQQPDVQQVLNELPALISARFPDAEFATTLGVEPLAVYLNVTLDIDDLHDVSEVVSDRLLETQVDEDLSINVRVEWPAARLIAYLEQERVAAREQRPVTSVAD
jgi:hypothetical protein